jgi:hypothetical protein
MNKITLLKQNDIFPPNKLNVDQFKCTITDFAILLGGYVSTTDFINEQYVNKNRTTWYRTQNSKFSIKPSVIRANGGINSIYNVGKLEQRKRPVISGSSVNNGANGSLSVNNIPQSNNTVKSSTSVKHSIEKDNYNFLEQKFKDGLLIKTGKIYEVDGNENSSTDEEYLPKRIDEYVYNGAKFVQHLILYGFMVMKDV